MSEPIPVGWPALTDDVMAHAKSRAVAALADEETVLERFRRYYDAAGNYAGATFLDLDPNDPGKIGPSDLLAVTTLSVTVHPLAIRRLTGHGPEANDIRRLLTSDELDPSIDIRTASIDTLSSMESLYLAVKKALVQAGTSTSNPWVTASKLCARKRPELFPVRDRLVQWWLGTDKLASYATDWQVFRRLRDDKTLMASLDLVVARARERPVAPGVDVVLDGPMYTLRHLDVALWMHARDELRRRSGTVTDDGEGAHDGPDEGVPAASQDEVGS